MSPQIMMSREGENRFFSIISNFGKERVQITRWGSIYIYISPHTTGINYFENSDIHLRYGSIFGGGDTEGKGLFLLQKKVKQNIRGVGK